MPNVHGFFEFESWSAKNNHWIHHLRSIQISIDRLAPKHANQLLSLPQNYMFGEMRSALSIEKPTDILDHIYTLSPAEQETAFQKIRDIESAACSSQAPQPGLLPLMQYLESKSLQKGICTRNFDAPVNHLLGKFLKGLLFAPIVTRDFRPPKPDPAGILHIAKTWGLVNDDGTGDGSQLIMVG